MSAAALRFDPANDTHYAISQDDELRLQTLTRAVHTIGMAFEGVDPDKAEISEDNAGQVFMMIANAIEDILGRRFVVHPHTGTRKPAA